jgi:hypothetical protein
MACNPSAIASLLTAASIAIAAAIVIYLLVIAHSSSWWTSGANVVFMAIAGVSLALAIGSVSAALAEAAKCTGPGLPCKSQADAVIVGLTALLAFLQGLLVAGVVAAIPSSLPWAGTAIGIAFAAAAVTAGAALIVISLILLPALDTCLGTASVAVQIQLWVGLAVGLGLFAAAGKGGSSIRKTGPPPDPTDTNPDP